MRHDLERDTLVKYSDEQIYNPQTISRSLLDVGQDYGSRLLWEKATTLLRYIEGKRVLDLGCGNGRHLSEIADRVATGIGVDFSLPFIRQARKTFNPGGNVHWVVSDGRRIPIAPATIDTIFSFAAIYNVDDIGALYAEVANILAPGGVAVLEVGNARSISSMVARQKCYADIAQHSSRTLPEHLRALKENGFAILEMRSFQLLPMWGDPPRGLRWMRSPRLERLMLKTVGGRMVDEWLSGLPLLRSLAFRHLIVCRKGGVPTQKDDKTALVFR